MKKIIVFLVTMTILLSACASAPASPAATATAAASPTPAYPTYSQVLSTYPAGTKLYPTDIKVSKIDSDGNWTFTSGSISSCGGTPFFKCYGVKITVIDNAVTIDGKTYSPGALLTVDKDLNWIQVSSLN